MIPALLIALVISPGQNAASIKSDANRRSVLLERAFHQRLGFSTARFKMRVEHTRQDRLSYVKNLEVNLADENWTVRNTGDDHGLVYPPQAGQTDEGAQVGVGGAFVPLVHFLDGSTEDWFFFADLAHSVVYTPGHSMPDFVDPRTYGLRAIVIQRKDPEQMADMMFASGKIQYSERLLSDGIVKVIGHKPADSPKGYASDYEWDIDTKNGPSVLTARQFVTHSDGRRELAAESTNHLSLIEGRWWPIRTDTTIHSSGLGFKVEFTSVEFDQPQHPKRLTPDSIGIPVGLPVRKAGDAGNFYYAGKGEIIDEATFQRDQSKFDLAPLTAHTLQARIRGYGQFPDWWNATDGLFGLKDVADRPDLWELYVRRWVMKRSANAAENVIEPLTHEQKTAAKGVLDDCRKKAQPVRARLDEELATIGKAILEHERTLGIAPAEGTVVAITNKSVPQNPTKESATKASDMSGGMDAVKQLAALRSRRAALEHSPDMQRLFDELKQRLENLLTSRQRDPNSITPNTPPPPRMATRPRRSP